MKILENGLVPVYEGEKGNAVNARELHNFLGVETRFNDWIRDRIEKYDFIENVDFISFTEKSVKPTNGRPSIEYILTLDTAKEISMVQNNEKGSQARKYFIAVEKKFKEFTKPACIEDVMIQSLMEMKDLKLQVEAVKQEGVETRQELQDMRETVIIRPSETWRADTNKLVKKICYALNDYQKPKDEIYKALQERGACDLKRRLENMRARLLLNGATKSKADNLNYLDVIAEDKKLIEIYTAIVKEMAIKYKAA